MPLFWSKYTQKKKSKGKVRVEGKFSLVTSNMQKNELISKRKLNHFCTYLKVVETLNLKKEEGLNYENQKRRRKL